MTSGEAQVEVDIPGDVQQEDETARLWAFLDEASDPSRILEGADVVSGDELDPVFGPVVSLTARPAGAKVHLKILPGDRLEHAEALHPAHLLIA